MPTYVRSGGAWRTVTAAWVRSGGAWRELTNGWVRDGGSWRLIFDPTPAPPPPVPLVTSIAAVPASMSVGCDFTVNADTLSSDKRYRVNGGAWTSWSIMDPTVEGPTYSTGFALVNEGDTVTWAVRPWSEANATGVDGAIATVDGVALGGS